MGLKGGALCFLSELEQRERRLFLARLSSAQRPWQRMSENVWNGWQEALPSYLHSPPDLCSVWVGLLS